MHYYVVMKMIHTCKYADCKLQIVPLFMSHVHQTIAIVNTLGNIDERRHAHTKKRVGHQS